MRNVLAKVPKASGDMVAAAVHTIFAQPDAAHVRTQLTEIVTTLRPQVPRRRRDAHRRHRGPARVHRVPARPLAQDLVDEPARATQRRDQATHQRRGHLPNDAAALRLITAVMVETHDEWSVAERRHLSEESMANLNDPDPAADEEAPLAITA